MQNSWAPVDVHTLMETNLLQWDLSVLFIHSTGEGLASWGVGRDL